MRRIELGKNPVRMDFLAHIVWPDEPDKRDAFISLTNDVSIAYLAQAQEQSRFKENFVEGHYDVWAKAVREAFEQTVIIKEQREKTALTGLGLNDLNSEIDRHMPAMYFAGYTIAAFTTMVQHHKDDIRLRGGPGIKKAQELIADIQIVSLTTVENAWRRYKSVAHFICAALVLENSKIDAMMARLSEPNTELIEASQFYRKLLTSYVPKRARKPLVGHESLWMPPLEWECNGTELIGNPIPEKWLDHLEERKGR